MIFSKSFINCHIKGLHSVILSENPIRRIFFTTPDHELNKLTSIAIHPHHCDITLVPLYGRVRNVLWSINFEKNTYTARYGKTEYLYKSKILNEEAGFTATGRTAGLTVSTDRPLVSPWSMMANELHTIFSDDDRSAWLVLEGLENPEYLPVCYADQKPILDPSLYQPMTEEFFRENFKS